MEEGNEGKGEREDFLRWVPKMYGSELSLTVLKQ